LFVDLIWRQLTLYSCGKGDLIQALPKYKENVSMSVGPSIQQQAPHR
jgi:hypothetical protein